MTSADHDLHTLAGAYVLDAVSPDERARFATHLADCAECRQEIRELREATARLGTGLAVRPGPEIKPGTLQAAFQTSQLAPVIADDLEGPAGAAPGRAGLLAGTRWGAGFSRWMAAAAVVLIAGVAALGIATRGAMQQLHHTQHQDHMIAAVLNAPDAVMLNAPIRTGGMATIVMSHSEHMGVFTAHHLKALPGSESYELWLMGPTGTRPAGMVKTEPDGMADPAVISGMRPGDMIGLTIEPAGGSQHPTMVPLVLIGPKSRR
jgi:anti-sigma-K factor RskA